MADRMSNATKPSNPKDAFGSAKAPLGLVPDTGDLDVAMAFLEGALKYGRFNWRVAGVRASIYNDAIRRHLKKWWNGENRDPLTRVKHLANLRACVDILMDAELCGMLEDDRPPALTPLSEYTDQLQAHIAHLKQLFAEHNPTQYTQKSHPRDQTSIPPGMSYADLYTQGGKDVEAYVDVVSKITGFHRDALLGKPGAPRMNRPPRVPAGTSAPDPARCTHMNTILGQQCTKLKGHRGSHFILGVRSPEKKKRRRR